MLPARVEGAAADEKSWYRPSTDKSPRMQTQTTDYGFHYAAIRRPIKGPATHNYIRVTEYVAPYFSLIPPNSSYQVATVIVPIDDETSAFHFIAWDEPATTPDTDSWRAFNHVVPGVFDRTSIFVKAKVITGLAAIFKTLSDFIQPSRSA